VGDSMISLLDSKFLLEFLSKTTATLIGVFVALMANQWISARSKRIKKEAENNLLRIRQKQFLNMYFKTLQKNRALIKQMLNEVKPNFVIFYNVDLSIMESTASNKFELINNMGLNEAIDILRYELTHLRRKVDMQFEMQYSAIRMNNALYRGYIME
jgi:hypothetical protein